MGDTFAVIADVEAAQTEAPALAAAVIGWLSGAGIIAAGPADCVLGDEPGYPPGPRYATAVTDADGWLPRLRTNGVGVCTRRSVFASHGELGPVACPHCGHRVELQSPATGEITASWQRFAGALDDWMAGGPARVPCPACGQPAGFNDWQWPEDSPIAIGFLGFTFWNWPVLTESFVAQVASRLGHRVVVARGKL